jgi:phage baseplate assembly protein W
MAIILGSKLVKDTQTYNDYAIGISLPIQITDTAFTQTYQTIDQVRSNIKNLLLTKKGERLMQPTFGSGLQEVLFEQITDETAAKIETSIVSALEKWLPYVSVADISVDINNQLKDTNSVGVSIKFSIAGNPDLSTVTFTVQG